MSFTDQRRPVIKFRFSLGKHKIVTYTVLAPRSTGCTLEQWRKCKQTNIFGYLVPKYTRHEQEKGNCIPYRGGDFQII